jgi:hypothetical protein
MLLVLLPEKFFDIERCARATVERTCAPVDLGAEPSELLDVRQQSLPDLLLIGVRQAGQFGDR